MNTSPETDGRRVVAQLRDLAAITSDGAGAQRLAWTATWLRAREWFSEHAAAIDAAEVDTDAAGNLWITLPGTRPGRVVMGSHLDSVPDGGWLDGAYGLVAGLEVMRWASAVPARPALCLVDWADEEGARFGQSLFGSSAAAGTLDVEHVALLVDRDGAVFRDVAAEHGVHLDNLDEPRNRLRLADCYLELHIEQGPVLDGRGQSLAAVTGTLGVHRRRLRITGVSGHAGAVPMALRSDPVLVAARAVQRACELALSSGGLATIGQIEASPGVATVVPREVTLTLDQRHDDSHQLQRLVSTTDAEIEQLARAGGCSSSWEPLWAIDPIRFDGHLVEAATRIVEELTGQPTAMRSGPLHDAVEVARSGIPTAMVFVPSIGGISHSNLENTSEEDLHLGVKALHRLVAHAMSARVALDS